MTARHLLLLVLVLLAPGLARADSTNPQPGIQLYENGEYEAATQAFTQVLADAKRSPQEWGEARIYLAASLHALGRVEETRRQLEVLAREHPEQRVDGVRFLPELAALAETIRQRVDTERHYAQREAERVRLAQAPPSYVRPEVLGLYAALSNQWTVGGGIAFHRGLLEVSARALLNRDPVSSPPKLYPTFQLHVGVLGGGRIQPHVGLRATHISLMDSYGAGAVAGLRYTLANNFVVLMDVGTDLFFHTPDYANQDKFHVTIEAGLGFDVRLPFGK
jgi:tetratricopeptide (TPR) repeat protein